MSNTFGYYEQEQMGFGFKIVLFLIAVLFLVGAFYRFRVDAEKAAFRASLTPCEQAEYDYQNTPFAGQAQVALLREIQLGCAK